MKEGEINLEGVLARESDGGRNGPGSGAVSARVVNMRETMTESFIFVKLEL